MPHRRDICQRRRRRPSLVHDGGDGDCDCRRVSLWFIGVLVLLSTTTTTTMMGAAAASAAAMTRRVSSPTSSYAAAAATAAALVRRRRQQPRCTHTSLFSSVRSAAFVAPTPPTMASAAAAARPSNVFQGGVRAPSRTNTIVPSSSSSSSFHLTLSLPHCCSSSGSSSSLTALFSTTTAAASDAAVTSEATATGGKTQRTTRRQKQQQQPGGKQQHPKRSISKSTKRPYQLVIVESPSKAKTISRILSQLVTKFNLPYDFRVDSCAGHVRDLPRSAKLLTGDADASEMTKEDLSRYKSKVLGIDVDGGQYEPYYVILPEKTSVVQRLQQSSSPSEGCTGVILATDEDREGEAIAWHLSELLSKAEKEQQPQQLGGGEEEDGLAMNMARVSFNEITPSAIESAFFPPTTATTATAASSKTPHPQSTTTPELSRGQIDARLVSAQETRRTLDRLAGYTVSPLLWKKIAPGLSAGRVQSVGLKLIVDRERDRMNFRESEYWDVMANLTTPTAAVEEEGVGGAAVVEATLRSVNGTRIATGKDFDGTTGKLWEKKGDDDGVVHLTKERVEGLMTTLSGDEDPNASDWTVTSVKTSQRSSSPPSPFVTSTLQQESNRRLGLSTSVSMSLAQQLYEAGYITYPRTDSSRLSNDAVRVGKDSVLAVYGDKFLGALDPNERAKGKSKGNKKKKPVNAQEAHEGIRPAIVEGLTEFLPPTQLLSYHASSNGGGGGGGDAVQPLSDAAVRLYGLVYRRTMASFMSDRLTNSTSVDITGTSPDGTTTVGMRASGTTVVFEGYAAAYASGAAMNNGDGSSSDEGGSSDVGSVLPPLYEGQSLDCASATPVQHCTVPPPRYTEATFVRDLERLGVGRPSTYAAVLKTLRDRAYVGTPVHENEVSGAGTRRRKEAGGSAISARRAAGGDEFMGSGRGPLVPSLPAFVVCTLLEKHCPSYVDPAFTARMEERLDVIAASDVDDGKQRISYLNEYYAGEDGLAAQVEKMDQMVEPDEARRADLPSLQQRSDSGSSDGDGDIGLFVGPWGPYVQRVGKGAGKPCTEKGKVSDAPRAATANLPVGLAADISSISTDTLRALLSSRERDGILIGIHPDDGRDIRWKVGRYGAYLQWGRDGEDGTTTHSLPRDVGGLGGRKLDLDGNDGGSDAVPGAAVPGITLEEAVGYVSLPRKVCELDSLPITAAIGPYGPYLKFNNTFVSLRSDDGDVLTVDAETATRVVTEGIINKESKLGRGVLADLGEKDGAKVLVRDGRFGIYLNWKKVNAKMPAEFHDKPSELPLEDAWAIIQEKAAASGASGRNNKSRKNSSAPAVKLPPPPKRPLSAYLHFCAAKRPSVAETVKSLGDVSKELARLWAQAGERGERQPYEDLAAVGKGEYAEKKKAWEEECDRLRADAGQRRRRASSSKSNAVGSGATKTGANKRADSPKKPLSAYLYFCAAKRPEVTKKFNALGDVSKELARLWAETAENGGEARKEFEQLAAKDKARYEEETSRLPEGKGGRAKTSPVKQKAAGKIARAPSAYMLFCSANRGSVQNQDGSKMSFGDTAKHLGEMWKACDAETRAIYEREAAEKKKLLASERTE